MDPAVLNNFCPVSNFLLLGKVVEMVVDLQFQRGLLEADNRDLLQSDFRPKYKSETALIILVYDLWWVQVEDIAPFRTFLDHSVVLIPSLMVSVVLSEKVENGRHCPLVLLISPWPVPVGVVGRGLSLDLCFVDYHRAQHFLHSCLTST